MKFEKWQALGNDYIIVEESELPFELTAGRVRRMCEAHTGIGSDGVLLLSPSQDSEVVAQMRIFNPDGSESGLSGNGARQAILYLRHRGWTEADTFTLGTAAGPVRPRITSPTTCTVDMGRASLQSEDFPSGGPDGRGELELGGRRVAFQHVQVGNPQCVFRAENQTDLQGLDLPGIGPSIEHHALFPNRTNVSWYTPLSEGRIRARIFERGVGETTASGTGATGAAVAYVVGGGQSPVTVELDGGELEVEVSEQLQINLSGWAVPVFRGRLSPEFIEELHATQ
ncbi:MAG TPA: diaminopimelate epimerase [Solirubrobacteraceae bacterium]|nr:diaminopimelate epimerase [Solirubrobacteraceae bacterium]